MSTNSVSVIIERQVRELMDIHAVAERYLRDIESGKIEFYEKEHKPEMVNKYRLIVERVVIAREEAPHYLAGIKSSGRPVWTHCLKLAVSYDSDSLRLADILDRMDRYQIPVDTMPACWFSNHQHGS